MKDSLLLYELYYISQSLMPVPSNLIPYFANRTEIDSNGNVEIKIYVRN